WRALAGFSEELTSDASPAHHHPRVAFGTDRQSLFRTARPGGPMDGGQEPHRPPLRGISPLLALPPGHETVLPFHSPDLGRASHLLAERSVAALAARKPARVRLSEIRRGPGHHGLRHRDFPASRAGWRLEGRGLSQQPPSPLLRILAAGM